MKFQIVSDSSCDLPKERAQELGVDIVPFYVSFEEENYMKEGVDISVEDFYQMMADRAGTFPKTSMPSLLPNPQPRSVLPDSPPESGFSHSSPTE